ncbi:MAG TPA: hypothetical protein VFV02_13175, partial [Acidimicrobiales bacterium]|nr:hypothetical protein [Acidimicrobiales bacterium]
APLRSTRPRRARRAPAVAFAVLAALAAGCGSGAGHRSADPTTTLLKVDNWRAPAVSPTPSTNGYCTSVVSIYKHVALLPFAANQRVRMQIVHDYLAEVPTMVSTAPPPVASDSKLYFNTVAEILGDLQKAGLNPNRLADPNLGQLLLDPGIKAAGDRVINFVKENCNYLIGG